MAYADESPAVVGKKEELDDVGAGVGAAGVALVSEDGEAAEG